MTEATPLPFELPAVRAKKLTVDFDGGNQSSDAGMLLLRGVGPVRPASSPGLPRPYGTGAIRRVSAIG
jgi:hypothetical protein